MSDTPLARDVIDGLNAGFGEPREPTYEDTIRDAALDLYKALRLARHYIESVHTYPTTKINPIGEINAALKKAEGRQY